MIKKNILIGDCCTNGCFILRSLGVPQLVKQWRRGRGAGVKNKWGGEESCCFPRFSTTGLSSGEQPNTQCLTLGTRSMVRPCHTRPLRPGLETAFSLAYCPQEPVKPAKGEVGYKVWCLQMRWSYGIVPTDAYGLTRAFPIPIVTPAQSWFELHRTVTHESKLQSLLMEE